MERKLWRAICYVTPYDIEGANYKMLLSIAKFSPETNAIFQENDRSLKKKENEKEKIENEEKERKKNVNEKNFDISNVENLERTLYTSFIDSHEN